MFNDDIDPYKKKSDLLRARAGAPSSITPIVKPASPSAHQQRAGQGDIIEIPVALLESNPHQTRKGVNPIKLAELAASIKEGGLLQPIGVIANGAGGYVIVYGHRRVEAHKMLGLSHVKAIVYSGQDAEKIETKVIIENIQRDDLSPIEYALSFHKLLKDGFYPSASELGAAIGKDRSTISKYLGLLKLPEDIIDDIASNETITDVVVIDLLRRQPENKVRGLYEWYCTQKPSRADFIIHLGSQTAPQKNDVSFKFSKTKSTIVLPALSEEKQKELEKLIDDFINH